LIAQDLFGKPLRTFPDHAPGKFRPAFSLPVTKFGAREFAFVLVLTDFDADWREEQVFATKIAVHHIFYVSAR
jgi:hypothetical protein